GLGTDRGGAAVLRRRPRRPRLAGLRRRDGPAAHAARRHRPRSRLLLGEPEDRGTDRRADRPGEHRARPAGPARLDPADIAAQAGRAGPVVYRGAPDPPSGPGGGRGKPVRWQPAEGAAGPLAAPRATPADRVRGQPPPAPGGEG